MKRKLMTLVALAGLIAVSGGGCGKQVKSGMEAALEERGISGFEDVVSSDNFEAEYSQMTEEDLKESYEAGFYFDSVEYYYDSSEEAISGAREYAEYLLSLEGAELTSDFTADEIFTSEETAAAVIEVSRDEDFILTFYGVFEADGREGQYALENSVLITAPVDLE